ncbi:DoxX family protein [Streptomyces sp. NPDC088785]|uniref:DoxX family protein n=1 Tax=Streptomyces sp. NPDC088785 TaxID=3365897 RepID=UPI0037F63A21
MTNLAAAPATTTAPARSRRARIALTTTTVVLAAFFALASALPKLFAVSAAVDSFETIGWGATGMYVIGALELAGAVALLVPVLSGVAPIALGALMIGACVTQIVSFGGENAATPLLLLIPLGILARARRDRNRELLALVRRGA